MKINKHAQSCFLIETKGVKILIDPGSYVFGEEGIVPAQFGDIDLILITHEHADHFDIDNIAKIVELCNPEFIAAIPVAQILKERFANSNITAGLDGFTIDFKGIKITGHQSKHGPLPTGKPAPEVMGYVIDDGESSFYTPGDSVFLNRHARADIIGIPVCGKVVMDIETAKNELLEMKPKLAIPMHYDNPIFPVNVDDFIPAMQEIGQDFKILKWGEGIDV